MLTEGYYAKYMLMLMVKFKLCDSFYAHPNPAPGHASSLFDRGLLDNLH